MSATAPPAPAAPASEAARAPGVGRGRRAIARRAAAAIVAAGALATALATCVWLTLIAADRPSPLSGPTLRADAPWLLGPLHGLGPAPSADHARLDLQILVPLLVLLGAWLLAWATAPALPERLVTAAVAACQVVFLLGPPQRLTDVFNYVVYGRMAAHGQNPYRVLPAAAPHDLAWALSNWHHLPSPYGPLFTLGLEPISLEPTERAFWVWKSIAVLSAVGVLLVVRHMAKRLGISPARAVACAGLCPVTLAVGVGGFHNDALAMLPLVAAAACLLSPSRAASAAAGAGVVLAAGLKPSLAVVAGIVVLGAHRRWWAAGGAAVAAAAVGLVLLLCFGGALPAIGLQGQLVDPVSVPNLLGLAGGHGGADATVRAILRDDLVLVAVAATALVGRRREHALPALGVVLFAAVLSLAWIMPWYLAWSLPFVALARPRALAPLAVVACVWLGLAGAPQLVPLLHGLHYFPTRTATGHANHLFEQGLLR